MRYLSAIAKSLPFFIIALVWGVTGLPVTWTANAIVPSAIAIVPSIVLGVLLGRYMSRVVMRSLFHGESHVLIRRPPGGVWFFIAGGLLGGTAIGIAMASVNQPVALLIVHVAAATVGALCCAVFGTLACAVLRLERVHGRIVIMGPNGFSFEERLHTK